MHCRRSTPQANPATAGFAVGMQIGPYRLARELGHGGMGVAWLAERADGALERPVALKLPGMPLRQGGLSERFALERDILAQLAHPNIAPRWTAQPHELPTGSRSSVLGDEHREPLETMNGLALLYDDQGKYAKAEPLYIRTLELERLVSGEEHDDTLQVMNNLAVLYREEEKYTWRRNAKTLPKEQLGLGEFAFCGIHHREIIHAGQGLRILLTQNTKPNVKYPGV